MGFFDDLKKKKEAKAADQTWDELHAMKLEYVRAIKNVEKDRNMSTDDKKSAIASLRESMRAHQPVMDAELRKSMMIS